jgi:hypothetical protein
MTERLFRHTSAAAHRTSAIDGNTVSDIFSQFHVGDRAQAILCAAMPALAGCPGEPLEPGGGSTVRDGRAEVLSRRLLSVVAPLLLETHINVWQEEKQLAREFEREYARYSRHTGQYISRPSRYIPVGCNDDPLRCARGQDRGELSDTLIL